MTKKLTLLEQARLLKQNILNDMRGGFELNELQQAGIIMCPDEDLTQEEIENIYETTDFENVIDCTELTQIIEFTKYQLTDYEKEELLWKVNDLTN